MVDLSLGDSAAIIAEARARRVLRNQLAYILATAKWETAHTMKPVYESFYLGKKRAEAYNRRKPYWPWIGRGYVQLTWKRNYERAQDELALGSLLTEDPDAALLPRIAAQILVAGMMGGWFTGKKLGDYVTLDRSDFVGARRVVNGTDKAKEIAAIAHEYDAALLAAGYGAHPDPVERPAPWYVEMLAMLADLFSKWGKK